MPANMPANRNPGPRNRKGGAHRKGCSAKGIKPSAIVPGAWTSVQAARKAANKADPKAAADWSRRLAAISESHTRADAKMFARKSSGELAALRRDCPGFAENENVLRSTAALKTAMLEARDKSGLSQSEIARRMGVRPSNLSRLLHGPNSVTGATFAAFLRACGFGFSVRLHHLGYPADGCKRV